MRQLDQQCEKYIRAHDLMGLTEDKLKEEEYEDKGATSVRYTKVRFEKGNDGLGILFAQHHRG